MGRNVEIKARVADPADLTRRVADVADQGPTVLHQVDTFFHCPHGRLKLREFVPGGGVFEDGASGDGELIHYQRPDDSSPTESRYHLVPTTDPASLGRALGDALGVRGVVRKKRTLYRVGQTRIHLDEVEDLGSFLELEVVLRSQQSPADGLMIAQRLMVRLHIPEDTLLSQAYIDLLAES
jgi:predicted adenylyl cyclase CyaB